MVERYSGCATSSLGICSNDDDNDNVPAFGHMPESFRQNSGVNEMCARANKWRRIDRIFSWKREERSSVYFRIDYFIRLDGYDETNDRNFLNEILEEKNREEYIFFFFFWTNFEFSQKKFFSNLPGKTLPVCIFFRLSSKSLSLGVVLKNIGKKRFQHIICHGLFT